MSHCYTFVTLLKSLYPAPGLGLRVFCYVVTLISIKKFYFKLNNKKFCEKKCNCHKTINLKGGIPWISIKLSKNLARMA